MIKLVGVVGLGLIGGSITKALKNRLNINVVAVDNNEEYINAAINSGTIIKGSSNLEDLHECDVIFICTPVKSTIHIIDKLIKIIKPDCILTDVGSTKEEIINFVENNIPENIKFIGGHPMAGKEKSGFHASVSDLFKDAYYILIPKHNTKDEDLNIIIEIVKGFGAKPINIKSELHDVYTAAISHVPHVIASGLVNMIHDLDDNEENIRKLAAGGFKDITRIASSNATMWNDICFANKKNICNILDEYITILNGFKASLINNENENIYDYFKDAQEYRDSFKTVYNEEN